MERQRKKRGGRRKRRKRDGHSPCRIINKLKGDSNVRRRLGMARWKSEEGKMRNRDSDGRRERQRDHGEAAPHEPSCGLFDFLESELRDTCESDGKEGRHVRVAVNSAICSILPRNSIRIRVCLLFLGKPEAPLPAGVGSQSWLRCMLVWIRDMIE